FRYLSVRVPRPRYQVTASATTSRPVGGRSTARLPPPCRGLGRLARRLRRYSVAALESAARCRMAVQLRRRRFTVAQYHQMAEAGLLRGDDRVELIDGEIIELTPIGRRHAAGVVRVTRACY